MFAHENRPPLAQNTPPDSPTATPPPAQIAGKAAHGEDDRQRTVPHRTQINTLLIACLSDDRNIEGLAGTSLAIARCECVILR